MKNKKNFMDYERPSVTADVVLFKMGEEYISNRQSEKKVLRVLLIKRPNEPEKDKFSLPGGFVGIDETIEDVAKNKVFEKTGYKDFFLEQLYTFDGINRDERWRVISTAYIGILRPHVFPRQYGTHFGEWFDIVNDNKLVGIDTGRELSFDDLAFTQTSDLNLKNQNLQLVLLILLLKRLCKNRLIISKEQCKTVYNQLAKLYLVVHTDLQNYIERRITNAKYF